LVLNGPDGIIHLAVDVQEHLNSIFCSPGFSNNAAPQGEISVSSRIITQGPVPQAISNEVGGQEFLHLFCLFESFLFSPEHSDALARERPLARRVFSVVDR
jgi:hypothetical protein